MEDSKIVARKQIQIKNVASTPPLKIGFSQLYSLADTNIDLDEVKRKLKQHLILRANGVYIVSSVVERVVFDVDLNISKIIFHRITAGSSGQTVIDVNKNGTSIFPTTPKPTITAANGDNYTVSAVPDIVAISAGDYIDFDIDEVELGSPAGILVEVIT